MLVMVEVAAILASLILLGLIIFQSLLILGYPLGRMAWGGKHEVLPTRLRIASGVSIIFYVLFIAIVLNQAGVIAVFDNASWIRALLGLLTAYFFVGIIMNAISRSKAERIVMTPVATSLALLFLYVTLSSG